MEGLTCKFNSRIRSVRESWFGLWLSGERCVLGRVGSTASAAHNMTMNVKVDDMETNVKDHRNPSEEEIVLNHHKASCTSRFVTSLTLQTWPLSKSALFKRAPNLSSKALHPVMLSPPHQQAHSASLKRAIYPRQSSNPLCHCLQADRRETLRRLCRRCHCHC